MCVGVAIVAAALLALTVSAGAGQVHEATALGAADAVGCAGRSLHQDVESHRAQEQRLRLSHVCSTSNCGLACGLRGALKIQVEM